ncbi:nucleotidyl transferase AbiEii/AbiGii toxin family protein [bacterium]|nr:nucleotidyl transferase AbiEii/AbiGii toxin family protein [bacterium]
MIKSGNLYRLQTDISKGNKTLPVISLEKDYVLTWILIGISSSDMKQYLCFKGGTALKKFYFKNYRFSEDLDFTLLKSISFVEIEKDLLDVMSYISGESNIQLEIKRKDKHTNAYVFYINYSGPLGADITKRQVKIDFTVDEKIIYPTVVRKLNTYSQYSDVPANVGLNVYPLEEIFIEKYLCIMNKARNEPRDIYDLWYLIVNAKIEPALLIRDIKEKGAYKQQRDLDILKMLNYKKERYIKLWDARLKDQMIDLPHFDRVYQKLKRSLKTINND